MKTRLLIIIGIVMITTIPFVTYAMLDWYSDSVLQNSFDIDTSPKPGDKYYIESERRAELVAVEQDLRSKISQLHQNYPLGGYAVNLDHLTKEIIVIVETEQFNSEIEYMISQYPDDIPIVFSSGKFGFIDEFEPELIPSDDAKSAQEHYKIEITGIKNIYRIGEQYDFSYIISGYGYSCGTKEITFPDQNGNTMKTISSSSCIAGVPMKEFVIDSQKQYDATSVSGIIKIPGIYNVTVTFDRPSQNFPTIASKEFRVVEK